MRGVAKLRRVGREDHGAALVTVLLFMMLTFILITTMLAVTGNESIIAGLHRDSIKATEMSLSGLQEAFTRIQNARNVPPDSAFSFNSSINSERGTATVFVSAPWAAAPSGNYREIIVKGVSGKANREIHAIVLVSANLFLPNHMLGDGIRQPGNPNPIKSGDVYSTTFVQYQELPSSKDTVTYSGWRISRCKDPRCSNVGDPDRINFCYDTKKCTTPDGKRIAPPWFPGTRLSTTGTSQDGQEILDFAKTHCGPDGIPSLGDVQSIHGQFAEDEQIKDLPKFGFTKDDTNWNHEKVPSQVDTKKFPCGLPFKYVERTFRDETNPATPNATRFFKTIIFEQWVDNYWRMDNSQLTLVKKENLLAYPEFGAIPPQAADYLEAKNFDKPVKPTDIGPDTIGCHWPEMVCASGKSEMVATWVDGTWLVNKPGGLRGHGMLLVNGDLIIDNLGANFEFWGTIIVRGRLFVNSGQLIIHNGGLIVKDVITVNGNFTIQDSTGSIGVPQVGPSTVVVRASYER